MFILQYMHEMMVPIDRINFQKHWNSIQNQKKKYFFADEILNFCKIKETVFSLLILLFSQSKYIAAKIYFRFFKFKQMRKKNEKFIKWKIKETNGIKVYILSVMSGHIEWTSSFYLGVTAYYIDETKKIRYEETYIICDIHSHWLNC